LFDERDATSVKARASRFDEQAKAAAVSSTATLLVGRSAASATRVSLSSPIDEHALVQALQAVLS
jgi:hypothetical protein